VRAATLTICAAVVEPSAPAWVVTLAATLDATSPLQLQSTSILSALNLPAGTSTSSQPTTR
jgi:hypothetical protein